MEIAHRELTANMQWLTKKALTEQEKDGFFWGNRLNEALAKYPEFLLDGSPILSEGRDIIRDAKIVSAEIRDAVKFQSWYMDSQEFVDDMNYIDQKQQENDLLVTF